MSAGTAILLERDNVNDEVVTLIHWFVKNGEKVEAGTLIAEIETSKANVEVMAPHSGYLYWGVGERADIPVSEAIGHILPQPAAAGSIAIGTGEKAKGAAASAHPATSASLPVVAGLVARNAVAQNGAVPVFASSTGYARRFSRRAQELLREHAIPEERFSAMAMVRANDVLAMLAGQPAVSLPDNSRQAERPPIQDTHPRNAARPKLPVTDVSLSRMKRSEAQSLAMGGQNTIPSAVSVTCLTRGLRAALQANPIVAGNAGAVIVYEAARLLRKYPAFNATYRPDTMLVYEQVNIGYAMDDGRGLKVTVIRDCDQKSLAEITTELRALTLAYLDDKLTPAQISGGTFTISDLSGLGVSGFLPLISEDQGAILGVGGEQFLPGSRDGLFTLTLAFDHQLTEGRTAALFLNDLKDRLLHYEEAMGGNAAGSDSIVCARCGRGPSELPHANSYMVASTVPPGHLCNLCMAGF